MDYLHHYLSPLGPVTLAACDGRISGLWFDGQKHFARGLSPEHEEKSLPVFDEADRWLDSYFSGNIPASMPALLLRGSAFQKTVWEILLTIPYGQTMTYGQIAARISEMSGAGRMSAQAVGGAVARNPISLIILCHRVIATDGSLTGYAGGIDKKARLLQMEQTGLPISFPQDHRTP